jgi:hypothetical protein
MLAPFLLLYLTIIPMKSSQFGVMGHTSPRFPLLERRRSNSCVHRGPIARSRLNAALINAR